MPLKTKIPSTQYNPTNTTGSAQNIMQTAGQIAQVIGAIFGG